MFEELMIDEIVRVVEHGRRGSVTSLTVVDIDALESSSFEGSTEEFANLNDTRVRSGYKDNDADTSPRHDSSDDSLMQTTKSLQSLDLTSNDGIHKDEVATTCRSLTDIVQRDTTQKLSCSLEDDPDSQQKKEEPQSRRGSRRRRRSLKDSLASLFSGSNHSERSSSPRARQRSSSPRSPHSSSSSLRGFTLSSLVPKRRSPHRKKNRCRSGLNRSSFASLDFELTGGSRRPSSILFRQSSSTAFTTRHSTSTAFTLAAREASQSFKPEDVMSDIEDQDISEQLPPLREPIQLDQTAATVH